MHGISCGRLHRLLAELEKHLAAPVPYRFAGRDDKSIQTATGGKNVPGRTVMSAMFPRRWRHEFINLQLGIDLLMHS
jgi:hypothetical protein